MKLQKSYIVIIMKPSSINLTITTTPFKQAVKVEVVFIVIVL